MGRRRWIYVLAGLIVVVGAIGAGPLLVISSRSAAVKRWGPDQCRNALAFHGRSEEIHLPLGYHGTASSCALRRTEGHLFGSFTGSGYYVITTDRELFVGRVDYADPGARFAPGQTVEIAPDDVPGGVLSASEDSRYRADVAGRGRVRARPWPWGGYDG